MEAFLSQHADLVVALGWVALLFGVFAVGGYLAPFNLPEEKLKNFYRYWDVAFVLCVIVCLLVLWLIKMHS